MKSCRFSPFSFLVFFFFFCNLGPFLSFRHHQASFDEYKAANEDAAANEKKERVETFEKLEAEVVALKESGEVLKSAFGNFSEVKL